MNLAVSSLSLLGLGIAFVSPAYARTLPEIKKSGEFRICVVIYPGIVHEEPQGCKTNCKLSGPAYDISTAFAKTLGPKVKPIYKKLEWDEQFHNDAGKTEREQEYTPKHMAAGDCDVYPSNVVKLPWREKKLDFVVVFPSRMMVVINKASKAKFKKLADLGGATLAVEKDTSFQTWAQKMNETTLKDKPIKITPAKPGEDLALVESGKADFALYDSDGALYATKHKSKELVAGFPVGDKDDIGWAFRKGNKDLEAAVDKWLKEQRKSEKSELNVIWDKYFGMSLTRFVELVTAVEQ